MAVLGFAAFGADSVADGYAPPAGFGGTGSTGEGIYESIRFANGAYRLNMTPSANFYCAVFMLSSTLVSNISSTYDLAQLKNATGDTIVSIAATYAETFRIYTMSSGVLTLRAESGPFQSQASGKFRVDVKVEIGATGLVEVYFNGSLMVSWSGDTSDGGDQTVATNGEFYGPTTSGHGLYGLLFTDDDSRSYHIQQVIPNATGSYSDFTGSYTAVNEYGSNSTTPFNYLISSETVGHKFSANVTNPLSAYSTGFEVVGVAVTARARAGSGLPKAKVFVKSGTGEAASPAKSIGAGDDAIKHLFTVNPETGLPWAYADLTAVEIGVEIAP